VIEADTALALALRDGDEEAVRELVGRFGGLVFTVANRVLDDPAAAEDVAQQTFVQAWRHADSFEPGRDFAPWLATIARRTAIDALRREQRRPTSSLEDADPSQASLVTLPPSAEQIERVWAVRAAVESLDEPDREIMRLHYVEGHTHSEIAERLDIPIGTVKSRTHRAHRKLARRLNRLRPDDGGEPANEREPTGEPERMERRETR
jgi:RNA polymerase sigma-70 factor (ECF subfamily)